MSNTRGSEGRFSTTKTGKDLEDLTFYDRTMRGFHIGEMPLAKFKNEFLQAKGKKIPQRFRDADFTEVLRVLDHGGETDMYEPLVSFICMWLS